MFPFLLFNLSNINPANPHSITATKVCLKNQAIPPATAKAIPKIPMACFLFTIGSILKVWILINPFPDNPSAARVRYISYEYGFVRIMRQLSILKPESPKQNGLLDE